MKVLYAAQSVAPYAVGGMQTVSRMHCTALASRGWDVVLVHASAGAAASRTEPRAGLREVPVAWPSSSFWARRLPGHYARELGEFSRVVDSIARRERPDIIYAEGPVALASLRRPRSERPPIVFHPHGIGPFQALGRWRDRLASRALRSMFGEHAQRSDAVLSQGGLLSAMLIERLRVPAARLHTLPNAIAPERCVEAPRSRMRSRRLLFVGRPEHAKGFYLLLAALRGLPSLELDVVGNGALGGRLSRLAGVTWHGVVRDPDALDRLYDQAGFLVLPSYSEGMPTVLLEALGRGLPVIATRVGAIPVLVEDGVTGWLTEPGAQGELRAAIASAIALPEDAYARLSRAALERVQRGFLVPQIGGQLCALLGQLAGQSVVLQEQGLALLQSDGPGRAVPGEGP